MLFKRIIGLILSFTLLFGAIAVTPAMASENNEDSKTEVSAEIMNAYGGAKSIVSMTYDDGQYETAAWMTELFAKYNLRASCMLIVKNYRTNDALVNKWQDLLDQGYLSLENHSMTHAVLPGTEWSRYDEFKQNNTPENYQYELIDSKNVLEEKFGVPVITFAASNNTLWTEAAAVVMQNYYAMRKGTRGSTTKVQSFEPIEGSDEKGGWYNPYMYGIDNSSLEENKSYVQACIDNGGWFISMTHSVINDSDDPTKPERYEAFYQFLSEKQAAGDIWVTTFADATRYLREKQNSKASAYMSGSSLFVEIDMNEKTGDNLPLTADIFNHPLTVKVEVPQTWDLVTYKVGGEKRYASTFTENGTSYVYVDVVPNSVKVEVIPTEYYTPTLLPETVGYVTSGGGFTEGEMAVSAHTEKFTVDENKKVYLKLNLDDFKESTGALIPIKTAKSTSLTLDIYGITDKELAESWSSDTINPYNAPLNDVFGSLKSGAEFISSVDITDADTYLLDVTEHIEGMKAAGAKYATVVITLSDKSAADELYFTLGTADDVPAGEGSSEGFVPYNYVNDFENASGKGGFNTGGIGTNESNSFEVGETEGKLGTTTKAIIWKTTRNYERNFLPGVLTDKGSITAADIGSSYRISFWFKAENKGSFVVWLGNEKTKATYTTYPADKVATFTVTDETVGKWVKYSHVFTIDSSNVAVSENKGGQDICFAITPKSFAQDKERPYMLYLDDITSTKINNGAKSAMIPTDSVSVGASDGELSVGGSVSSYDGIRKAYFSFRSDDLKYAISAKLGFKVNSSYGQNVMIYAFPDVGLNSDITFETAPGAMPDESVDTSFAFRGIPLWTGVVNEGEFNLDLSDLAKSIKTDSCTFVIVTADATERELVGFDFNSVKLTAGIDYTADGEAVIQDGKMSVSGGEVRFNNAFSAMSDGEEYIVRVLTDPGVTLTVGESSATADGEGVAVLTLIPERDGVLKLSSTSEYSVYGVTVKSADRSIRLQSPTLDLALVTDYNFAALDLKSSISLGKDIILKAYIEYNDDIRSVKAGETEYGFTNLIDLGTETVGDTEYYVFEETFAFSDIARDFAVAVTVENEDARLVSKTYSFSPLRYAELTLADISSDSDLRGVVIELLRACKTLCSDDVALAKIASVLDEHVGADLRLPKDERVFTPDESVVESVAYDLSDGVTFTVKMPDGFSSVSFRMGAAVIIDAKDEGEGTYTFTVPYHAAHARFTVLAIDKNGAEVSTSFNLRALANGTETKNTLVALLTYAECVTEYRYKK